MNRLTGTESLRISGLSPEVQPQGAGTPIAGHPPRKLFALLLFLLLGACAGQQLPAVEEQKTSEEPPPRIAFVSWRAGSPEVLVMKADGPEPARLTYTQGSAYFGMSSVFFPRWHANRLHGPEGCDHSKLTAPA